MDEWHPVRDLMKGMVHVSWVERLYRLPPSDSPQSLGYGESATYHTLCVSHDTFQVKDELKDLGGYWHPTHKQWLFQESESAPAASVFPEPLDDDDPTLRPKHRTFNLPKTVPTDTHDAVLYMLGGLQRCDLPLWVTPPAVRLSYKSEAAGAATTEPPNKAARSEKKGVTTRRAATLAANNNNNNDNDFSAMATAANTTNLFESNHPKIPAVETRVHQGLEKGLSGAALSSLLTIREHTAKTGAKAALASRLKYKIEHDSYHTTTYRKELYRMVASGELPLVPVGADPLTAANAMAVADAVASLPWDVNGNLKD